MKRRMIAVGILCFTLLPSIADAGLFRHGRCCRSPKRCTVEKAEPCEGSECCEACADASQAGYNAFAGPEGIYGVNTFTGQVYKYNDTSGKWEPLGTSIP